MGSSKKITIGYRYFVGMHLVQCHTAPKMRFLRLLGGERTAYTGNITANQRISINQPDLYGGEKKEGGIVGDIDLMFGLGGQPRNDYLQGKQAIDAPGYLGVFSLVLRQVMLSAISPYLKPLATELAATYDGWYPLKAEIGTDYDMNPAHMVRECYTNRSWGKCYPASEIDDASFTAVADTLSAEGFGLSFLWYEQEDVDSLINNILNHVDGVCFEHPVTGLVTMKLARNDYAFGSLVRLNPDTVIEIEQFERPGPGELVNELSVRWEDRNGKPAVTPPIHDMGALQANGGQVNAATLDFDGVATAELADRIAMRELMKLARPLLRVTLTATRHAASITIGSPFVLDWPDYGIEGLVMRAGEVEYGSPDDPIMRIVASEDVFDNPSAVYVAPPSSGWVNPHGTPADVVYKVMAEATWWDIVRRITGESTTLQNEYNSDGGVLMASAVRPGGVLNFQTWTRQGTADYADNGIGDFCPTATLVGALNQSTAIFGITNQDDVEDVAAGTWLRITGGALEELCSFVSYDPVTYMLTVKRAVLDTTPQSHPAGARLFFSENFDFVGADNRYLDAETLDVKLLPVGATAVLALATASNASFTFAARHLRPYPPGKVQVNTVDYPASVTGDLTIAWAHRDRLSQTAYLVDQTEASIGPEAGTTYTVRIYNAQTAGTLIRTYSALAGVSQVYTAALATTDNGGVKPTNIRVEIESVRGAYASRQKQVRAFAWA